MTVSWLILLPIVAAITAFIVQRWRLVSILVATAALTAMIVVAITRGQVSELFVLGRAFSLLPYEVTALILCYVIVIGTMVYSSRVTESNLAYAITMAALALFSAATMMRSLAVSVLLLEIGIILAVMLIPSPHPRSQMTAMRTLILLALVGPLLSLAAWALEGQTATTSGGLNLRVGAIALAIGMGLALPVVPLHIWLAPIYRYSTPLAIVISTAVLNVVVFVRIYDTLPLVPWAAGKEFFAALLLGGGVLTAVLGGLLTLPQRALHRALAFTALADTGLALIGLGIGAESVMRTAMLHTLYRALAVTVVSMALGLLRAWLHGDEIEQLQGAARQAPATILGMIIGGLSLAGMPFTAGFGSRYLLYQALARWNLT